MTLIYRGVLGVDAAEGPRVPQIARREFRRWLRDGHGVVVDHLEPGEQQVAEGARLSVSAYETAEGAACVRLRLAAETTTTLTAYRPAGAAGRGWLWLDIDAPRAEAAEADPVPPPLIRQLLTSVTAYDGPARLTTEPVIVTGGEVQLLIDVLCDPDRAAPALVASPHGGTDPERWHRTVGEVAAGLVGRASLYFMDAEATEAFGRAVVPTLRVYGGAVRTYLPVVDPASEADAARHPVMPAWRILDEPDKVARTLAQLPRDRPRGLPAELRWLDGVGASTALADPLARGRATLDAGLDESAAEADADGEDPDAAHDRASRARAAATRLRDRLAENQSALLGAEVALAGQEDRLRAQSARAEAAEAALAEARRRLDTEIAEHAATQAELVAVTDRVRWLENHLVAHGLAEPVRTELPEQEAAGPPADFRHLLERAGELRWVTITADPGPATELDADPRVSTWASKAWQALLALDDYADARRQGFPGAFYRYCLEPPPGRRAISANAVKPDESDTVKNDARMRAMRLLPVPTAIDSTGRTHMWSHLRVGQGGGTAPRLYFHDDTAGHTRRVYVGYLGPHLKNTRTN